MLFGLTRVGPRLHFLATCLVTIGTLIPAFWILAANSWMQTPADYVIGPDGRFAPESWWAIIFNPSFPYRFAHSVTGAYLTTAMIVGAVGAWHLLRDRANPRAWLMFSMAMWMAAIVAPAQLVLGDLHGVNTFEHQPAKSLRWREPSKPSAPPRPSCSAGPTPRRR
jgi:cytochrome d ubiquinol oxidase subunit I